MNGSTQKRPDLVIKVTAELERSEAGVLSYSQLTERRHYSIEINCDEIYNAIL